MKLIKNTLVAVFLVASTTIAFGQYCTTAPSTTAEGEITNVVLTGATFSISNLSLCPTVAALEDYTATDSADVVEGSSYTATITISPCGGFALDPGACQGWIDWNQNGVFNTNESIGSWTGNIYSSNKTATFNFTVPTGATPGSTRMRILLRQGYGAANTPPLNPCGGGFSYGAVEDYTVRVTALPSPCSNPSSPSVGALTDTSAVLYWNSTLSNFDVEYGLSGFTQGAGTLTAVTNDTVQINGLTAQTSYDFFVRSNCTSSGNGSSSWIGPVAFTTPCSIRETPYAEDFDAFPNSCFVTAGGIFPFLEDTISGSVFTDMTGKGPGDNAILLSPQIHIDSVSQVEFSWSHSKVNWANDKLFVYIKEQGTSTWYLIWNIEGNNFMSSGGSQHFPGNFIPVQVNLNASYIGKIVEFKVEAISGGYGANIYFDDFEVRTQDPCAQITSVSFSNIMGASADINFISAGNEFHFEWGLTGFQQGTGISDTGTSSPFTIHSLNVNNTYDVYLRRTCVNGIVPWIGPYTFTTNCGDFPNTYSSDFDADSVGIIATCWSTTPQSASGSAVIYQPSTSQSIQPFSSPNYFTFSGYPSTNILVTPEFSTIDQNAKQIEFEARTGFGFQGVVKVIIGTLSNPQNATSFVVIDTIEVMPAWNHFEIPLLNVLAGHNFIGFKIDPTSNNTNLLLDDFVLTDQPPCLSPSGFNVSNLTSSGANVSWKTLDANSWSLEYGFVGFQPGNGTIITGLTSPNYSISGLISNVCYDVYLSSTCAIGTNMAGPFTFCTLCPEVSIPYTENFTVWPVTCWDEDNGNYNWDHYSTANIKTARANLTYWPNGRNAELRTVAFNMNQVARVKFKWSHLSAKDELYLTVRIQPADVWDTLAHWSGTNFKSPAGPNASKFVPNTMVDEIFYLDSATFINQVVEFKFEAISGNQGAPLFIDDFVVEAIPLCPEPVGFYEDNITGFSAEAHWQGLGNKFKIEYGLQGFGLGTGISISDSTTSHSYQFSGLMPATCYDYYVRNECGTNGNSAWMGPYSFCTDVSCPKPKNIQLAQANLNDAWVSWTTGGAANWNIALGNSPYRSLATVTNGIALDSIQLTGLLPSTNYYFWVQDSCGLGDVSYWEGPFVFSTGCSGFSLNYLETFDDWKTTSTLLCWETTQGDQPWQTFAYGTGFIATFRASQYASGTSGQLISPELFVSDTAKLHFKWSHTIDINNPNDSLFVLARIVGAAQWDTLKVFTHSNFILANAATSFPAPNMAGDTILLPANYVGQNIQINFYSIADNSSDMFIDDVVVEVDRSKVSCAPPTNTLASNITVSSANLNWTSNGSAWQLSFGANIKTANQGLITIVSSLPHAVTGLNSGTEYNYFVREICSAGDTSAWSLLSSFNTICQAKNMPYVEDFSTWFSPPNLPCWNLEGESKKFGPYSDPVQNSIGAMADFAVSWNLGDKAIMTSPEVNIAYPAILKMKWHKQYRNGRNDSIFVLSRVAGTTTWDTLFVKGGSAFDCNCNAGAAQNLPGGYAQDVMSLPLTYVGQNIECAVYVVGYQGYNLTIDEISIEQDPVLSCIGADNLEADSVSCSRALVSWNSTASTLQSNLVWDVNGFDPTMGGNVIKNVISPVNIIGLLPGTQYDIYVQDSCAVGLSPFVKLDLKTLSNPKPIINANHVVMAPGSVSFDASTTQFGTDYLWVFGDGDSSTAPMVNHGYSTNGTFTVMLFVSNECGMSDTTFVLTIQGIAVSEYTLLESLQLYPNPTSGMLSVRLAQVESKTIELSVMNLLGQTLIHEEIESGNNAYQLDLSAFENGTYLVSLRLGNAIVTKRIIIQK